MEETNPINLELRLMASRITRNTLLLLKAPSLWHLIMAALASGYTPKPQHSPVPRWGGQLELFPAAAISGSDGDGRGPSCALGSTWHLPSPSRSTESSPGAQVTSLSGVHLYARLPAVPLPGPFLPWPPHLGKWFWLFSSVLNPSFSARSGDSSFRAVCCCVDSTPKNIRAERFTFLLLCFCFILNTWIN